MGMGMEMVTMGCTAKVKCVVRDERGSIAIIAAVTLTVLLAAAGVAITFSLAQHQRSAHQASLDAAVLAAAGAQGPISDESRIAIANDVFTTNLRKKSMAASTSTSFDTSGQKPSFLVQNNTVKGISQAQVKNYFAGIVGDAYLPFQIDSAAQNAISEPVCVLALDRTSPQGIEIYGTAQFTARNCAAQSNSADGAGLRQYGNATGKATQFGVRGGFSGDGFTPKPVTGVPTITDPYSSIPTPSTGACVDIASKLVNTPAVLTPGTYCGAIRIMANSQIIMQPGVYVMLDGPFRIDSNSTVTGTEVVIAFKGTDSTLYLGSGAIVNLTSPTSGPYMNIQFFQDRESSVGGWATLLGNIKLTFDGVMYFPTQHVWIGGGSRIEAKSPSYIFVTDKLWFQDNSIIDVWQEDSRGLDVAATAGAMIMPARLID